MKIESCALLAGVLVISGSAFSAVNTDVSTGFPEPVQCEPGETLEFLRLETDGTEITQADLPFKGNYGPVSVAEDSVNRTRFEICNTAEFKPKLRRIIQQIPSAGFFFGFNYNEIVVDQPIVDESFEQAIFGEPGKLHLEFKNEKNPKRSFLLKGHVTQSGKKFVSLSEFDASKGTPLKTSGRVVVGTIQPGDPFVRKSRPAHRLIEIPGASIEFELGYRGSPGIYVQYDFQSFKIRDTNLNPAVTYDGKGEEDPALKVITSHHGLSDSFEFTVPGAKYVLSGGKLTVTYEGKPSAEYPLECWGLYECGKDLLKK